MKLKKVFIIWTGILCILLMACGREDITEDSIVETKKTPSQIEDFYTIMNNVDETYTLKLIDNNKEVIDEITIPNKPHINKLEDDIIQVVISYGSPFYITYFYDTKNSLLSQAYDTPVLVDKGKIVFMEGDKLIVTDIFDREAYYKQIERAFSETVPPSSAIISARFINSDELQVDYYVGKDFMEKSEIIDLVEIE
ncbi:hypothetical protein [Anaerosporobacter sp.]|uniref:hypothetical protein n=1 Tax=Anaerosporobacter sp. TaxID=1872529 RepID=UPI00286ED6FD|nr:hypothetical protein [Anaerosporobacter sp.]